MYILVGAAAFVAGIVITAAVLIHLWRAENARRRKRKGQPEQPASKHKVEFSKLILVLVLLTYFAGVGLGTWAVVSDTTQLGVVLAFIGTPTATTIIFYVWKAKAENIIKIKKENPEETEGVPVDVNNISA